MTEKRTFRVYLVVPYSLTVQADTPEKALEKLNGYKLRNLDLVGDYGDRYYATDATVVAEIDEEDATQREWEVKDGKLGAVLSELVDGVLAVTKE